MVNITSFTLKESLNRLKNKEFSATELTEAYLKNMQEGKRYNAYVTECADKALEQAKTADAHYANGTNRALEGIPLGIKDLFCTKDIRTTACSHILDNFIPQYESTVTQNLLNDGAVFLGKLNLDEFAMGGSNETSYFGPVINPWSKDKDLRIKTALVLQELKANNLITYAGLSLKNKLKLYYFQNLKG